MITFLKKRERIFSLDVFRGLAIIIMIFVDAPPAQPYSWQAHAVWEGLTLADWAFPAFVFAMGASAAVSTFRRNIEMKKIFFRTAILFLIGVLFNMKWHLFTYLFQDNFTGENFFENAIEHGRFFGILQRLALTYFLGMFLAKIMKSDTKIFLSAFGILIIYSLGFHLYSLAAPFEQADNISGAIDKIFPGINHIYLPTHDPEGLYGTLASSAQFLFGFLAGKILANNSFLKDKIFLLTLYGIIFLISAFAWNFFDIIAKNIWTSPFALITSGGSMILFAFFLNLFEKFPTAEKFFQPISAMGKNPLFFFLASNILVAMFWNILVDGTPMWIWFWQITFQGIVNENFSVMIFCIIWTLLWILPAVFFDRHRIIIKVPSYFN